MRARLFTAYRNPSRRQLDPRKTTPISLSQDLADYDRVVPSRPYPFGDDARGEQQRLAAVERDRRA